MSQLISLKTVDTLIPLAKDRLISLVRGATKDDLRKGRGWYRVAHKEAVKVASRAKFGVSRASALLACLSPSVSWERNVLDAYGILEGYGVATYGRQHEKAIDLINGGPIEKAVTGKKVNAFYHCILDPFNETHVVLDRHAGRTALGLWNDRDVSYAIDNRYAKIADAFKQAANELGERPCEFQAIAWIMQRRAK